MKQDGLKRLSQEEKKMYLALLEDIIALRKGKGFTQKKLTEITGLEQSNISRFENAEETATVVKMSKILNALGYKLTIIPKDR